MISKVDTHDHEWRLQNAEPALEDGRAIFMEECGWVEITGTATSERLDETFYETGAECDEVNRYWFNAERAERKHENSSNTEYNYAPFEAVEDVEINGEIVDCDSDKDLGRVEVETDDWIVIYKP
jgi:hypothetical protein